MPDTIEENNPTETLGKFTEHEAIALVPKAFMGVAGIVIIIVIVGTAGVVFGLISCKADPEERGGLGKVSHCVLMTTVFLGFLFMPFYMIPGAILFGVGAPFNMICQPLLDLSIFPQVIISGGKYILHLYVLAMKKFQNNYFEY